MQRNPHSYQIATGYRTFYSLSLIYQPITKKRLFFTEKEADVNEQLYGIGDTEQGPHCQREIVNDTRTPFC